MTTPTPRTDKQKTFCDGNGDERIWVSIDFARELERELTTAKSDLDSAVALYGQAKAELERLRKWRLDSGEVQRWDALYSKSVALRARVGVLEEALREIESQHLHTEDAMIDLSDLMAMRAQQALASSGEKS